MAVTAVQRDSGSLTVGLLNGVILQPSFVTVPSSGMSRVTCFPSNLISVDSHLAEGLWRFLTSCNRGCFVIRKY